VSAEIEKGNAKATGCTPRGATLLQRKEQQEEEEEEEEEEEQEEEEARRCFNAPAPRASSLSRLLLLCLPVPGFPTPRYHLLGSYTAGNNSTLC